MGSLEESRKAILKLKGHDLADSTTFQQAVKLAVAPHDRSQIHDLLSLLLVVFRHLRAAVLTGQESALTFVSRTLTQELGPALHPSCPVADALVYGVENSDKISLLRASDVLGAACRLAVDLARSRDRAGADILVPLYRHIASGPMTSKGSLIIVNQIIASVPVDAVPEEQFLPKIISQLAAADYASIRASIYVEHWQKKVSAPSADAEHLEREMLLTFLPHLIENDDSAQSIVMARNLSKYLLPALFKAFPKSCSILLTLLESAGAGTEIDDTEANRTGRFRSWIRVASLGSSLGAVRLLDLPGDKIDAAKEHKDFEIRRQLFEMAAGQNDKNALLAPGMWDLFHSIISSNAVPPASSNRTEWGSAIHLFFTRLLAADITAKRHLRRTQGGEAERKAAVGQPEEIDTWLKCILHDIVDQALLSARRPPSSRVIVALIILQNYLTVFAADTERGSQLFSPCRVKLLIGCQACEFAEVRARSHALLKAAPNPLPGYATLQEPSTRVLLDSAWKGLANPRKTQNDAAVAALQIVFERVVLTQSPSDEPYSALSFVGEVADRLEHELLRVAGSVQGGLEDMALHGLVAGCRSLVVCIDLSDPQSHGAWKPLFQRLSTIVHRIWHLTRRVMSLSTSGASERADGPAHEIAKAYQLMSDSQDADADDDLDPRKLVSGCWRATKEAGELLAALIDRPLNQSGAKQVLWSREEVDEAGKTFLQWMHEIRHRGTFSAISSAFAELVATVKKVKNMSDLPALWLDVELQAITDDTLSTTRRSAALPYSLLSIVAGDEQLLDTATKRLLDLARIDNNASSDVTKVHCFNILKVVLLDARQSKLLGKYFEDTVMMAVEALHSPNWNVRNVALMLFSTLVNRSLQSARTSQHMYVSRAALEGRQTFAAWHSRYPRILPCISAYLERYTSGGGEAGHTALFPMLIILRSLKWSEDEKGLQAQLSRALRPYLGSPEWQVRQVAAQSLSSLYSPEDAISMFAQIDLASIDDLDLQHGTACFARNLMENTLPVMRDSTLQVITKTLRSMIEHVEAFSSAVHPVGPIEAEVWATYSAFVSLVGASSADNVAGSAAALSLLLADGRASTTTVIGSVERDYARVQAANASSSFDLTALLKHHSDAVVLAVLGVLTAETSTKNVISSAISIALDEGRSHELRLRAMRWLCDIPAPIPERAVSAMPGDELGEVARKFAAVMGSHNTLLREQGMVACAWALGQAIALAWRDVPLARSAYMVECKSTATLLAAQIAQCAAEDQSQPSREAAASALSHLWPTIFAKRSGQSEVLDSKSKLACLKASLALLQDDDDDIRQLMGDVVSRHWGARPLCQAAAHDMWWTVVGDEYSRIDRESQMAWEAWFKELARDDIGYSEDDLALHPENKRSSGKVELFEQEKPNLFRDPLIDAAYAAHKLRRRTDIEPDVEMIDAVSSSEVSPIDAAFSARLRMPIRRTYRGEPSHPESNRGLS